MGSGHVNQGSLRAARSALLAGLLAARAAGAADVEVMHSWPPDGRPVQIAKQALSERGHIWKDFAVAPGGANGRAIGILQMRVQAGNSPAAALIRPPLARRFFDEGRLADLDSLARAEQWDARLPEQVREAVKYRGRYIAVPVTLHRSNWMWVNTRLLARAGVALPRGWDAFFDAAERLRQAGITPVAHGGQPWQNLSLFQNVALSVGGAEFYRSAFIRREPAALRAPVMLEALRVFRRIRQYTQRSLAERDWPEVTNSLVRSEAAFQFIGDWVKPQLMATRETAGFAYACAPMPGHAAFAYVIDSFSLFKSDDRRVQAGQQAFASMLLAPAVQMDFNAATGSRPTRRDVAFGAPDACAQSAAADLRSIQEAGSLVPSFTMTMPHEMEAALSKSIGAYWDDDRITPQMAAVAIAGILAPSR